jgi:DNA polymerase
MQRVAEPATDLPRLPGLAAADWLVVSERLDDGDPQQEQLLENMLRAIGVGLVAPSRERRAACVTVDAAGGSGDTARAGVGSSAVHAAIDAVAPRCVLALGRAAAGALLGAAQPLGGLRGRVHDHAGVPVVVTFSLAFLLRHPAEKAKAWADLCLAVRALSA